MRVREAIPDEHAAVMGVLDAAVLDIAAADVRERIDEGDVLVGVERGRVLGALVLDGAYLDAVAVRPGRRGQGVGSALVGAAAERVDGPLVADFDGRVRAFYESLGFEVEPIGGDRYRGTLH